MKPLLLALLAGSVIASGCGKNNSSSQTTGASPATLPANGDYGSTLANAQNHALAVVDLSSLKQAVDLFNAQEGRYPSNLDELVKSRMIREIPPVPRGGKLDYNPATGEIKIVQQ